MGGRGYFKNHSWKPNKVSIQNMSFLTLKLRPQISIPGIQDPIMKKKRTLYSLKYLIRIQTLPKKIIFLYSGQLMFALKVFLTYGAF